jgi:hypothetical protein
MHSDDTLRSVMLAEYYANSLQNENNNLYDTLFYDEPANKQYLRYWHGSASIVRLMHIFFDIKGIYITNGILLSLLAAALFAILIHGKIYSGAVGLFVSLISAGVWYVPLSLEYTWNFIIMFVISIAVSYMAMKDNWKYIGALFMVSGIVTNFFDFLTTETLTLLIPLLIAMCIKWEKKAPDCKMNCPQLCVQHKKAPMDN